MKVFQVTLALLFFVFAAVQYNDPDPLGWILIYAYVGVILILGALDRPRKYMTLAGLAAALIWMATLVPDFIHWIRMGMPTIVATMKAEAPHIELTREFLGLLVCVIALGWQWMRVRKQGLSSKV